MDISIRRSTPTRAFQWLACGWQLTHRRPGQFIAMATLYLLLALLLARIPFLGTLLLLLITPALAAGALLAARESAGDTGPAPHAPSRRPIDLVRFYGLEPVHVLLRPLRDERRVLATIILCMLCFGLVLTVKILEYVLVGGSMISGLRSPELSSWLRPSVIAGMVMVIAMFALLVMAFVFIVPLTMFGNIDPLTAVGKSFAACTRNSPAMLLLFAGYLAALALPLWALSLSAWLGYFVTFTLGPILLATALNSLYCCYRDIFGTDQAFVVEKHFG